MSAAILGLLVVAAVAAMRRGASYDGTTRAVRWDRGSPCEESTPNRLQSRNERSAQSVESPRRSPLAREPWPALVRLVDGPIRRLPCARRQARGGARPTRPIASSPATGMGWSTAGQTTRRPTTKRLPSGGSMPGQAAGARSRRLSTAAPERLTVVPNRGGPTSGRTRVRVRLVCGRYLPYAVLGPRVASAWPLGRSGARRPLPAGAVRSAPADAASRSATKSSSVVMSIAVATERALGRRPSPRRSSACSGCTRSFGSARIRPVPRAARIAVLTDRNLPAGKARWRCAVLVAPASQPAKGEVSTAGERMDAWRVAQPG